MIRAALIGFVVGLLIGYALIRSTDPRPLPRIGMMLAQEQEI
jgi:uncharacterized membrane-anchored protein YhcB (DUF1043 family)